MKRAMLVAAMLAGGWAVAVSLGEEGREGDGPRRVELGGEYGRMAAVCALTDDQRKQIAGIQEACEKEIREVRAKYQTQIQAVFTEEQKAKWNESVLMTHVTREFAKVKFSDTQLAKIKQAIGEQTKGAGLVGDERAAGDALRKVMDAIRKDVLTTEQKATLWDAQHEPRTEGEGGREGGERK